MRWILLALLMSLVATCGQKGPLHLPEDGPEGAAGANVSAVGGGSAIFLATMSGVMPSGASDRRRGESSTFVNNRRFWRLT